MRLQTVAHTSSTRVSVILVATLLLVLSFAQIINTSQTADSSSSGTSEFKMDEVYGSFPLPPYGFHVILVVIAFVVGKGLEVLANKYLGLGFRVVGFDSEFRSVMLVCHELTMFADNLGMFADPGGKNLKRFIKFLKRRNRQGETFRPVIIIYRDEHADDDGSRTPGIRSQFEKKLEDEKLEPFIKFVEWSSEYPKKGYLGLRMDKVGPGWNWYRLRYWIRYRTQEYYSGVVTARPFISSKSKDDYEILKRYLKCELNNKPEDGKAC